MLLYHTASNTWWLYMGRGVTVDVAIIRILVMHQKFR